ncbi:uncharacterized protein N0V89_004263 [Didymosphaeria variabile]|uniref:C2H2-type domain-containing protein n=1 Tax=Didymosphaeria variabile TaxID=1932322 RepID=A0A9W8XP44_9PLEO|nr:uncharacterized protein N0V89_004263 [Didymosphaeria variabile]KAJ4356233.1 hypothetical protein N0V89_004263 [Didymosphaeria variabile]
MDYLRRHIRKTHQLQVKSLAENDIDHTVISQFPVKQNANPCWPAPPSLLTPPKSGDPYRNQPSEVPQLTAGQDQKFSIASKPFPYSLEGSSMVDLSNVVENVPYAPDNHKRQVALSLAGTITANDSSESDNLTTVGDEDTRSRVGDGDARKFSDNQESLLSRRGKTEYSSYCEVNTQDALNLVEKVVKGILLSRLLDHALPEVRDATGEFYASSGGPNTCTTTVVSSLSSSKNGIRNMAGKRARKDGKDPGDGGGDDSDDGNDDRPKKKASSDRFPQQRLKCPFHQRQPERYTKAACRGEGFAGMGKLKDHLKRVHMHPLRCLRCHVEMSEEELEDHLDRDDICARLPAPQDDRIAPQKLWRLDFKKAPFVNARSTEEKWKIMYKMLFPADSEADVPSPCQFPG